jgi:hypothetical protein
MKLEDYFGFGVAFIFGIWLLAFPRGVVRVYTWFHRSTVRMPEPFGVRLSGALWITLVSLVLVTFLMHR